MRIQKQLPQFTRERALLLVVAEQFGVLYVAENGELERMSAIEEREPKYADKEGFFMRGGRGDIFSAGSVRERAREDARNNFLKKFSAEVKKAVYIYDPTVVFVFCPRYTKSAIEDLLPDLIRKRVRSFFFGNYTGMHPFSFLTMIRERETEPALSE
jgi:hypothetical protein